MVDDIVVFLVIINILSKMSYHSWLVIIQQRAIKQSPIWLFAKNQVYHKRWTETRHDRRQGVKKQLYHRLCLFTSISFFIWMSMPCREKHWSVITASVSNVCLFGVREKEDLWWRNRSDDEVRNSFMTLVEAEEKPIDMIHLYDCINMCFLNDYWCINQALAHFNRSFSYW